MCERNIDRLPLSHNLPGWGRNHDLGMCPDWKGTDDLLLCWVMPNRATPARVIWYIYIDVLCLLDVIVPLIIIKCPFLSLVTFFILKSILSEISTAIPTLRIVLMGQKLVRGEEDICKNIFM